MAKSPHTTITINQAEELLGLYSLEQILEQSDMSTSEALVFLIKEGFVDLPKVRPVTTWDDTQEIVPNEDDFD